MSGCPICGKPFPCLDHGTSRAAPALVAGWDVRRP